jgi:hypothetical protein
MAATKSGWWLKICAQKSKANFVIFDIGVGGDDSTHRRWLDYTPNGDAIEEFDAPADLIQKDELWWGVEPYHGKIVASLMWQGHCVQTARCERREEYEKHQDNTDGCDC